MPTARRTPRDLTDAEEARIQAGIAADPDNPEITQEQFARMRPAADVLPPALYEALIGQEPRPKMAQVPVTLSLDADVVEAFRAASPDWQIRMNDALKAAAPRAGQHPTAGGRRRRKA